MKITRPYYSLHQNLNILKLLIIAICLMSLTFCAKHIDTPLPGLPYGDFRYEIKNGSVSIVLYTGSNTHLILPDTIEGILVTSVGYEAFRECNFLEVVEMPNITTIEKAAFSYCSNLTRVVIGPGVTTIPEDAFYFCLALTTIDLTNITTIDPYAFGYCSLLETINAPNLTTLGESVFLSCEKLTSVTIPKITSLPPKVFKECISLKTLNSGLLTDIATEALRKTALLSIDLSRCSKIDDWGLSYSASLSNIDISNITFIGDSAFANSKELIDILLLNYTPPALGVGAFTNAHSELVITIPKGTLYDVYGRIDNINDEWSNVPYLIEQP